MKPVNSQGSAAISAARKAGVSHIMPSAPSAAHSSPNSAPTMGRHTSIMSRASSSQGR